MSADSVPKAGQAKTDWWREMAGEYLTRLEKGEVEPGDQATAAAILGELIRLLENTLRANAATQQAYQQMEGTLKANGRDELSHEEEKAQAGEG